jgi:hypothetical protein
MVKEKQYLSHAWLVFVIFIIITIFMLWDKPFFLIVALPFVFLVALVNIFLFKLSTEIKADSIRFRFFPYQIAWREYKTEDIKNIEIIHFNAIGDYGGWGRRHLIYKNEKAYFTKSGSGLRFELKSGAKIMVGIKNPDKIKEILNIN